MNCLDEKTLSLYLDKKLTERERAEIEEHVSSCNRCLDFLVVAYDARRFSTRQNILRAKSRRIFWLAQTVLRRRETKWLLAAIAMFILSFVFKKFFLQFLVAAAILGFKWAMEGEGARRAIMIFKGIGTKDSESSKSEPHHLIR